MVIVDKYIKAKILKNLFVFIASYVAITYVSLGIQLVGYFLVPINFFGGLFNPRYRLFVSNCDRTANYFEIVLFSITFLASSSTSVTSHLSACPASKII